jgi:transcriptional regulator of acetoin/glycerol metabolism
LHDPGERPSDPSPGRPSRINSVESTARRALLDAVRAKLGGVGAARAVGLSRAALYRYLSGEAPFPPGSHAHLGEYLGV